jgi:hypothetical protein
MEVAFPDDPVVREHRRSELARRLIAHSVRTQTISDLTGMSRNRLATLRRRLMVPTRERRRGPPPRSVRVFLTTPNGRTEGAALAALCAVFNLSITGHPADVSERLSALGLGERLCDIYESYQACFPDTEVQFEELISLRTNLARGVAVELGNCRRCRCLILIDRFGQNRRVCSHCEPED